MLSHIESPGRRLCESDWVDGAAQWGQALGKPPILNPNPTAGPPHQKPRVQILQWVPRASVLGNNLHRSCVVQYTHLCDVYFCKQPSLQNQVNAPRRAAPSVHGRAANEPFAGLGMPQIHASPSHTTLRALVGILHLYLSTSSVPAFAALSCVGDITGFQTTLN